MQHAILAVVASHCVAVCAPEQTVTNATVADEEDRSKKHKAADSARLAFEEEPDQIECHEHDMGLQQRWINGFRYEQYRNQPLQAIHFLTLYVLSLSLTGYFFRSHTCGTLCFVNVFQR